MNPLTSAKTFSLNLKSFLNNKKIPCIPSPLYQNRYMTQYRNKAELISNFFANQCSITNHSSIPPPVLFKRTEYVISSINFSSDDITKNNSKL